MDGAVSVLGLEYPDPHELGKRELGSTLKHSEYPSLLFFWEVSVVSLMYGFQAGLIFISSSESGIPQLLKGNTHLSVYFYSY